MFLFTNEQDAREEEEDATDKQQAKGKEQLVFMRIYVLEIWRGESGWRAGYICVQCMPHRVPCTTKV